MIKAQSNNCSCNCSLMVENEMGDFVYFTKVVTAKEQIIKKCTLNKHLREQ